MSLLWGSGEGCPDALERDLRVPPHPAVGIFCRLLEDCLGFPRTHVSECAGGGVPQDVVSVTHDGAKHRDQVGTVEGPYPGRRSLPDVPLLDTEPRKEYGEVFSARKAPDAP